MRAAVSPLLAGLGVLAAGALAGAATLGGAGGDGDDAAAALLKVETRGKIELSNSKHDSAIVRAPNLAPGDSVRGRVAIGLSAPGSAHLQLAPRLAPGTAGPFGGELAEVLRVEIDRPWARRAVNRKALYRGRLAKMTNIGLGRISTERTRRYRVTVTFPDGGSPPSSSEGDNAYQGSNAEVELVWRARPA